MTKARNKGISGGQAKKKKKLTLYRRCRGRCFWCNQIHPIDDMTIDHIIPFAEGGPKANTNLRLIGELCRVERDKAIALKRKSPVILSFRVERPTW